MHSLGSTKLHTMGDDPTHNANVGRDMQLKGGGEGQLTVACFLYFMQFNLYTPTGCLVNTVYIVNLKQYAHIQKCLKKALIHHLASSHWKI